MFKLDKGTLNLVLTTLPQISKNSLDQIDIGLIPFQNHKQILNDVSSSKNETSKLGHGTDLDQILNLVALFLPIILLGVR